MSIDIRRKSVFFGKGRGQKQTVGDTVNLAARLKVKKKQWKVSVLPEEKEEDDEENLRKDFLYQKPFFDSEKIYQLISEIVEKSLKKGSGDDDSYVYSESENANLCQRISKDIRDTLKTWRQLMRFRIVALTSVIEKKHQGLQYKMKYLVDPKTDNYVKYYLDNPNFFIVVCVVLIYQD
ncbi:uncharacterized protein [Chironomus tepperi]|uniref:uncharacterized protein n=1 Tax=Chironomus tepperi TaxID=113505 RepID=UPI00391FA238